MYVLETDLNKCVLAGESLTCKFGTAASDRLWQLDGPVPARLLHRRLPTDHGCHYDGRYVQSFHH